MKLGALALSSLAGMTLTSMTVWSMTAPPAAGSDAPAVAAAPTEGAVATANAANAPGAPQGGLAAQQAALPGAQQGPLTPGALTTSISSDTPAAVDKSTFQVGGTLMMEGRLGHAKMAAQRPGETFAFFDINANGATGAGVSTPVNLAIVIDHSGSMKGQRLTNAINAARGMIGRLRDGDTVSVIGYNTSTDVLVPATTVSASTRPSILARVQPMPTQGHTCMSCGIEAGMRMLSRRAGGVNRMLVLSDGEANRGVTDLSGLRTLAANVRNRGASISSIGVDVDYNERVMFALARESNGRHHFVENASKLTAAFDTELKSLVASVADQASLSIELGPGVILEEVFDRTFTQVGNRVVVPLGMFTARDKKTVLMRLNTPSRPAGEMAVAKADLVYDDLSGGKQGACHGELAAALLTDPTQQSELDPIVLGRLTRRQGSARHSDPHRLAQIARIGTRTGGRRRAAPARRRRPAPPSRPF